LCPWVGPGTTVGVRVLSLLATVVIMGGIGCGVPETPAAGVRAGDCALSRDCAQGLVCVQGECVGMLDAGQVAVALDAVAQESMDSSSPDGAPRGDDAAVTEADAELATDAGTAGEGDPDASLPDVEGARDADPAPDVVVVLDAAALDAAAPDASAPDASAPDALALDATALDAFAPDAFAPDAAARDAAAPDAFAPDASARDASAPDATLDAGVPLDASVLDSGLPLDAGAPLDAGTPVPLDLSGWTLVNTEDQPPTQTYTFPAGTTLRRGEVLLVVRDASRAEVEAEWGRSLASSVVVLRAGARTRGAPIINGGERWALRDATGTTVDGPTAAGLAGFVYQRTAAAAGVATSWSERPETASTPGVADGPALAPGVWITEWADASGSGRFVFEYVELAAY
jgi:hypothetical protein